jgi:hypothetical protein
MDGAAEYLASHYSRLGDQQDDFRNANLHSLIAGRIRGQNVLDIGSGNAGGQVI